MNLAELQSAVYTITNRPDRVAETLLAVQQATLKVHRSDFYFNDLVDTGIYFATTEFIQEFDCIAFDPLWRSPKYLRKSDVAGALGSFLTVIQPESVLDNYKLDRLDVYYAAGRMLHLKSSTEVQYMFLGYYKYPNITEANYSSWIAESHPFVVVNQAAAIVSAMLGKLDEAKIYGGLALDEINLLKQTEIQAVGY